MTMKIFGLVLLVAGSALGQYGPPAGGGGSVTAGAVQTAITPQTGCSTAGYVWSPQSNTCVATLPPYSDTQIAMWGDSLTVGNQDGSGTTQCTALTSLTNLTCYSNGVVGQTSTQIAIRMGAVATTVTNSSTIPAGAGSTVAMTFPAGYEPAYNATSTGINGTVDGVVGTLLDNGSHVYTFTRTNAGSATPFVAGDAWTPVLGTVKNGLNIIEVGRNNILSPATVLSDIAAMVASIPGGAHYVVATIPNSNSYGEWFGGVNYDGISAVNQAIVSKYPVNVVDYRTVMMGLFTSTLGDHIWWSNHVTPESLHAVYSSGTLTAAITTTTTCSFTTTLPNFFVGSILTIDSEKIYVQANTGASVTACQRGWEGTTAATHLISATVTQTDPLHFSGAGYTNIAGQINNWMLAHPSTAVSYTAGINNLNGAQLAQRGSPSEQSAQTTNQRALLYGLNGINNSFAGEGSYPFIQPSAVNNTACGVFALQFLTTGSYNVGCGTSAGYNITTGAGNIAVGNFAIDQVTTGSNNFGLGNQAGHGVTTGSNNIALGAASAQNLGSHGGNVAIGANALQSSTASDNSVAVGTGALQNMTASAGFNVGVGLNAGAGATTSNTSTFIGNNAGNNASNDGLFDCTAIGNLAQCDRSLQVVLGDTSVTQVKTTGTILANGSAPTVLYSAAGTPLPTCGAGIKGEELVVIDATSPTYLGTYTSGGAVVAPVMCNGTVWVTY